MKKVRTAPNELVVDYIRVFSGPQMESLDLGDPIKPVDPGRHVHGVLGVQDCNADLGDGARVPLICLDVYTDEAYRGGGDERGRLFHIPANCRT